MAIHPLIVVREGPSSRYHSFEIHMRTCVLVIAFALYALPSTAQQSSSATAPNQNPVSASHTAQTTIPSASKVPLVPTPDQERIEELARRVRILELQMAQRSGKSEPNYNVAIIGALAVIGASLVGIFGQVLAARHAAKLARDEALHKEAAATIEFRMTQVQKFHAPMFALLRQSKDLYDKTLEQLVEDEPSRYRKVPKPAGKDFRWEVLDKNGVWQGFRLLDQFPAIKKNLKALALADKNLELGASICMVISRHAGYASESIVDMLGQYTAHHAILSTIRNGTESEPFEPGWHKVGYFPFGLDTKIAEEYHEISRSIDEYRRASTQTLETLAKGVH
jgi:hypothetical protein